MNQCTPSEVLRGKTVYFYEHSYMRERQLDTVRGWPSQFVVNPGLASRVGAQVGRAAAVAPGKRSLLRLLPLMNLKRRPAAAPEGAVVYVWGAMLAVGDFCTDLDNPYALTGYQRFASRLYRAPIRHMLLQDRCIRIFCLSEACRRGVAALYGEDVSAKACVAYPHLKSTVLRQWESTRKGALRLLFVGTQFEIKGGRALVDAVRALRMQGVAVELTLVTHLPPGLQAEYGAIDGIHIVPATMSRDELIQRHMLHSDVLVHPTYMDSFAMVVLEAIGCGLPVIASRHYAIPEMVIDGQNGFLIDPPISAWNGVLPHESGFNLTEFTAAVRAVDTAAFSDALRDRILRYVADPSLCATQGLASRAHFERTFQR